MNKTEAKLIQNWKRDATTLILYTHRNVSEIMVVVKNGDMLVDG